jgi:hypothetical protein
METLAEALGLATPFAYAASVYGAFAWLENDATENAKSALAGAMRLREFDGNQVGLAIVEVFDLLYTRPLLGLRALFRSILFTVVVTAVYSYEHLPQTFSKAVFGSDDPTDLHNPYRAFLVGMLLTNAVTDHVSLFAIRKWLAGWGASPVLGMLFGAFIGLFIVGVGFALRAMLTEALSGFAMLDFDVFKGYLNVSYYGILPGALVFVWLPLFAFGILAIRAVAPLSWVVTRVQWASKSANEHPLRAVGCVAAGTVFVAAAGWQIASKIW